jgi:hypothetical protein
MDELIKTPTQVKIAILTFLLTVVVWADISVAPPEQSWTSGTTTVTLSGATLTVSGTGQMMNYGWFSTSSPWSDACSSITGLVIDKEVREIGANAFSNCTNLTSITVLRRSPPAITSSLGGINPNNINLYVPIGSAYAYRYTKGWDAFDRVNGVSTGTANALWVILAGFFIYGLASWMFFGLWFIFKKIFRKENKTIKNLLKIASPIICLVICGIWIAYFDIVLDIMVRRDTGVITPLMLVVFFIYGFTSFVYRLLRFIIKKVCGGERKKTKILLLILLLILCLVNCVIYGFLMMFPDFKWWDEVVVFLVLALLCFFFYGFALCVYRLLLLIVNKIRCIENSTATKSTLMIISPPLSLALLVIRLWVVDFYYYHLGIKDALGEIFWAMYSYNYAPFYATGFFLTLALLLCQLYRHYLKKNIKRPTVTIILTACNAVFLATLFIMRWI